MGNRLQHAISPEHQQQVVEAVEKSRGSRTYAELVEERDPKPFAVLSALDSTAKKARPEES